MLPAERQKEPHYHPKGTSAIALVSTRSTVRFYACRARNSQTRLDSAHRWIRGGGVTPSVFQDSPGAIMTMRSDNRLWVRLLDGDMLIGISAMSTRRG